MASGAISHGFVEPAPELPTFGEAFSGEIAAALRAEEEHLLYHLELHAQVGIQANVA